MVWTETQESLETFQNSCFSEGIPRQVTSIQPRHLFPSLLYQKLHGTAQQPVWWLRSPPMFQLHVRSIIHLLSDVNPPDCKVHTCPFSGFHVHPSLLSHKQTTHHHRPAGTKLQTCSFLWHVWSSCVFVCAIIFQACPTAQGPIFFFKLLLFTWFLLISSD